MDCKTARLFMDLAGPRGAELDTAGTEALADHLDQCSNCNRLAQTERLADEQLGTAMRDIRMPGFLRNQILARLDLERHSWHRRWPQRHPRVQQRQLPCFCCASD